MSIQLILLFTALPLIEIYLLIRVGTVIGALPTTLLVVGTGVLGALMARREGLSVLARIKAQFRKGQLPTRELINGVILLLSGALLLTPGILTDFLGLLGLVPWFRNLLWDYVGKWFEREWKSKRSTYIDVESED